MHNLKLPKEHLSFTQIEMWIKSKDTYRKKYYGGVKYGSTPEMNFGNIVTLAMEKKEEWVSFIPHYPVFERELRFEVEGIPVLAHVDNFDPETHKFGEQKTGVTPWTDAKVCKHKQLDLYSVGFEIVDGFVDDECRLIWVKTEKKRKTMMMGDIELQGDEEIVLTGEYEIFKRRISQVEREAMKALIVKVGREIEEDFAAYKHLYIPNETRISN